MQWVVRSCLIIVSELVRIENECEMWFLCAFLLPLNCFKTNLIAALKYLKIFPEIENMFVSFSYVKFHIKSKSHPYILTLMNLNFCGCASVHVGWTEAGVHLSRMWVNGCFSPSDLNNSSNGRLLMALPDWLIRRLHPIVYICSDGGESHRTSLYFSWLDVSTSQFRICFK